MQGAVVLYTLTEASKSDCILEVACGSGEGAPAENAQPAAPSIDIVQDDALDAALAAHRGEGMLVNFWAIWCEPCVAELPELIEVAREYEDRGGRVVGLSFDLMVAGSDRATIEDTMAEFASKHDVDIPILIYSGLTRAELKRQQQTIGAVGCVTKVEGPDGLRRAVTRALGGGPRPRLPSGAPLKPWERLKVSGD